MKKFNVIFIVLDGLRKDRIHLCPFLMNILRKGYFFSNMITVVPYTLGSFHSIITGLHPSKHGVDSYFNMYKFKKNLCKTFTQYLHEEGFYAEGNLVDDADIPSQGFDALRAHDEYKDNMVKLHKNIITKANNKQFFLFLQYGYLHTECAINVGKKFTDSDERYFNNLEQNKKNYNSWLKKMDLYVKEIYEHIEKLGMLKNTIVVFFSDHGTSNGEKIGEKMYGTFTYDYTLRVFCSFLVPHTKGKEIPFQTRTIDIMPTILDILKIDADESYEHIQGKSLIPFIEGKERGDRIAFSETGGLNGPWPSHYEHNVFCVRLKKLKLIYNKTPNTWEMYDLENDPDEKNNIFDNNRNRELTTKLQKMLLDHIKSNEESMIYKNII
ncbi:MAG: sulfatase-like hydrolase/transferase [Nanoarchaeota archaeon]|nr:sulfatase-like hydrolase/transferase [Nanoarchaeota archaeon]